MIALLIPVLMPIAVGVLLMVFPPRQRKIMLAVVFAALAISLALAVGVALQPEDALRLTLGTVAEGLTFSPWASCSRCWWPLSGCWWGWPPLST